MSGSIFVLPTLTTNSKIAAKQLLEFLVDSLWPATLQLKKKFTGLIAAREDIKKELQIIKDIFSLCCNQIQKCMLHLLEIFQTEHRNHVSMQESRDCTLDRLFWCLDKLRKVEIHLENISQKSYNTMSVCESDQNEGSVCSDSSMLATPMYFVNWIDHALEVLTNLSSLVYKTDYKESTESFDTWMNEVLDSVSGLHTTVDELLLAAMTLSRYCLPSDQPILTVRCQVVLRETKKLIGEIINGNVDTTYKVIKDSLKLPLKPTNINVFIDVLKDTLYVLEANTNTALLALLVHCFSDPAEPLKRLENHFREGSKGACPCEGVDNVEDCLLVKEFDFHNERLMQIAGFSISCSSDENRILSLKSSLASLEALDPHLVPAVMLTPDSHHTGFLTSAWTQEVMQIRNSVFLIVDPLAFSEKAKETMNRKLLGLIKAGQYVNTDVCAIITIGDIVWDFFMAYKKQEPEALEQHERLEPLLCDLQKVLKECKTVSNMCSTDSTDFVYEMPQSGGISKKVTVEKVIKRLKLLFTIVSRINNLFSYEEEISGVFNDADCENTPPTIDTNTVIKEQQKKEVKTPGNPPRTPFGREQSIHRYSPSKCIISKLTKNLNAKTIHRELSFSVQLDELFDNISLYTEKKNSNEGNMVNQSLGVNNMSKMRNSSILYNFPVSSKRDSMRKVMMRKKLSVFQDSTSLETNLPSVNKSDFELDVGKSMMDSTTQLQITEILDQLSDLSKMFDTESKQCKKTVVSINSDQQPFLPDANISNVLTLSVNNHQENVRDVWNIPVNQSSLDDTPSEQSDCSSIQSNVTTLERLNDINVLENRLNALKTSNV